MNYVSDCTVLFLFLISLVGLTTDVSKKLLFVLSLSLSSFLFLFASLYDLRNRLSRAEPKNLENVVFDDESFLFFLSYSIYLFIPILHFRGLLVSSFRFHPHQLYLPNFF